MNKPKDKPLTRKKLPIWLMIVIAMLSLQFIYVYAFFIEPNWVVVKKVTIRNPALAKALAGKRIIQLSDLHIKDIGLLEMRLIEKVNRLKPDMILITGDFVDTREGINAAWDVLSLLEAKVWKYAIAGDMDDYHIKDLLNSPRWEKAGVTLLENRALKFNLAKEPGKDFWIVGIHNPKDLKTMVDKIPLTEPIILLSPDPEPIEEASKLRIDLVLAGDTHGGQVNPKLLRSILPFAVENRSPYVAGLFKKGKTLLYVNRGIGTSHINVRFLCWPEITVFKFKD